MGTLRLFPRSPKVCPASRFSFVDTLNNHTKLREVLVKAEVWFSSDMTLNTTDGNDVQSPDIREFTLPAASSKPVGNVFRLPAKVPADVKGQTYVFVRAVPYEPQTDASLLDTEFDQMNNAVMTPDVVKVEASGAASEPSARCPSRGAAQAVSRLSMTYRGRLSLADPATRRLVCCHLGGAGHHEDH